MDDREGFKGLRLTNTLTGRKEEFVPLDAANVLVFHRATRLLRRSHRHDLKRHRLAFAGAERTWAIGIITSHRRTSPM